MKSRRMRCAGIVTHSGQMKNLVPKPEEKRPHGLLICRWNIKSDLK
jgi:hypothetical protein